MNLLKHPSWLGVSVGFLACLISTVVVWQVDQRDIEETKSQARLEAIDHSDSVQAAVDRALSASYALAALLRQGGGTIADFDAHAAQLIPYYPGITSLQLAPAGIVQQIYPLAGNEKAIGHNLLTDPLRTKEAFLARDTGKLTLAGPFKLVQGGLGLVGRLPVFLPTKGAATPQFWGFAIVMLGFPDILQGASFESMQQRSYQYRLWKAQPDTGEVQILAANLPETVALLDPIEEHLDMPNGQWTLSVAPSHGWRNFQKLTVNALLAGLLSILLGWLARQMALLRLHEKTLAQQVTQRTEQLSAEIRSHRSTEAALVSKTERLAAFFDTATEGIHILDLNGLLIEANGAFLNMLGLDSSAIGKLHVSDWDMQDNNVDFRKRNITIISAGENLVLETRHRRQDGQVIDVEINACGMVIDGQPCIYAASRDITERKQAQAAIEHSGDLLRAAIETIDEAFVLFDPDDRLVLCNDKYRQIYASSAHLMVPGVKFEDLLRFGAYDGQYADAIGREEEWLAERMAAHLASNNTLIQKHPNGRTLRIIERKMPDGHIVGFRIDITDMERATKEAQAANLAKSRFLATMSHEIRTPMNGVLGMAQLLLMPNLSESERRQYARTILSSGQTLLTLLNDILDLSKIEAGKLQLDANVFAPELLLRETNSLFIGAAQSKSLQLAYQWQGSIEQRYLSDAYRLRQMLSNLVGNAIKFTSSGHVRIEGCELERGVDTALLEFSVQDSGVGIAQDKLGLLFKPFSQTDSSTTREFGGSGLGLSIVRNLALTMGGDVGVQSELGRGSRFWFRVRVKLVDPSLDRRQADQLASEPNTSTANVELLKGHLLVAEDNPVSAMVIESLLGKLGLSMTLVGDGQLAVQAITDSDRQFDLILMDLHMPVLDGYAATQQIRQWERENNRLRLPIIALTADAFEEDRQHCLAVGMNDFLTKPVAIAPLKTTLAKWLPSVSLQPVVSVAFKVLNTADFAELVQEITPLLEQNKFSAIGCYKKLQDLATGTALAEDVDALEPLLRELHFDAVLERLRGLLAKCANQTSKETP